MAANKQSLRTGRSKALAAGDDTLARLRHVSENWLTAEQCRSLAAQGFKVTLVVAGASPQTVDTDPAALRAAVAEREAAGTPRKQAIAEVARIAGVPKREVYDLVHKPPT